MQELFSPLPRPLVDALQDFPKILHSVQPMQTKHRVLLPKAIEELSTRLTSERSLLQQPYWSAPRFTSAYIWYFLPWNILRLSRLLHGLTLPEPTPMPVKKNGPAVPRIFADLGSGPLSLPIALWLAKPEWRHIPLTVLCTDLSPQPLAVGQKIFEALAGKDSPWRIVTKRCPIEGSGTEIYKTEGIPWLITAANVCNELKGRQDQSSEDRLEDMLEKLLHSIQAPDTRLLFVEPGTRLGGKTIVSLREMAQQYALHPAAPCSHGHECPLDDTRTWCHFTFDTQGAPRWLTNLSAESHLRKEALSLSFLLLQQKEQDEPHALSEREARIISAPFRVPGLQGYARYACAPQGLTLLDRAEHLPSGALVRIIPPRDDSTVDKKSGAFIVRHEEKLPDYPPRYSDNYGRENTERRPYSPHKKPDYHHQDKYQDKYNNRDQDRYQDRYQDDAYGRDKKQAPREEKKKKVIKPSKKNEKKFWEK